jgi:hypothetical protein
MDLLKLLFVNFTFFHISFALKILIFDGQSLGRRKLNYTVFDGIFSVVRAGPLKIRSYFRR